MPRNQLTSYSPYASALTSMEDQFADYRKLSGYAKSATDNVQTYIDSQTKSEKEALEAAFERYQNRLKIILKNDQYVTENMELLSQYRKQQNITLQETNKAFMKMIDAIKSSDMTPGEQDAAIDQAGDYIMSQLMSKEELDEFKSFMQDFMIVIPNQQTQTSTTRFALKSSDSNQTAIVSYS